MKAYLPEQLFNQRLPGSNLEKVLLFPLWRLIIFSIFLMITYGLASLCCDNVNQLLAIPLSIFFVAVSAIYLYINALIENRPLFELDLKTAAKELGIGLALGAVIFSIVVFIMWLAGVLSFEGMNSYSNLLNMLPLLILAGFIEEYIFRGIIFKLTEEILGTWLAILLQAALFGLIHAGNENASAFSTFAIAVEAGILLVAVYMITRRLWIAIGLHFAWNWIQGPFYGIPVSGHDINGLFETTINGPELLTGGAFGAEASIIALITCTVIGLIILVKAIKLPGNLVKPMWIRNRDLIAKNTNDENTIV